VKYYGAGNSPFERFGDVKYAFKDGIVYDAKQLLADVAAMIEKQKEELGELKTY